jgi:HEAT repeat protein
VTLSGRLAQILNRLFSIHPGEEKKTTLLYALFFVFWLGLRWGGTASETLFLDQWSAADLSLMFVGNALVALIIGLLYNSFADRVRNERLLLALLWLTMLWLVSVQALLLDEHYNQAGGLVYAYFYLVFLALADLTSLHTINYISDFYDTRAAKRALPLLLSSGFTGAIAAGLSIRYIPARYAPLAWMACLGTMLGLVRLIRRWLPADARRIESEWAASRQRQRPDALGNLRAGFSFVRGSGLLRWLTLSTLALVVLMKLLTFQASTVFAARYEGEALKEIYGTIDWVSNSLGLALPPLAFGPLLARLGVANTNLFFPLVTLLTAGALGYFPGRGTAILGRLTDRMIKKAFRNPTDAMLYNSVPLHVKNRARGFVNGLVVPLGSLLAGLMLLAMQAGWFTQGVVAGVGVLVALAYVYTALRVRREYGRALADLLAQDELGVFRAVGQSDFDPTTLPLLYQGLRVSQDDQVTIFIAELLYDLQGRKALVPLHQLATQSSPPVRASLIRMLGAAWVDEPSVRQLCLAGLNDPHVDVRRAAATALAESRYAAREDELLRAFRQLLGDRDDAVRASAIPPLMASGDFHYLAPAVIALSGWLAPRANSQRRALGLRVLFKTGDERLANTLTRYLHDPSPLLRAQAAQLIGELAAQSPRKSFRRWSANTLRRLLRDSDASVRLTAVNSLGAMPGDAASRALLPALGDRNMAVRRRACVVMPSILRRELETLLASDDPRQSESAAFLLTRAWRRNLRYRAIHLIQERIEALVVQAYRYVLQCAPLQDIGTAGARLWSRSLRQEADALVEHALWLTSAFGDERKSRAAWQSLQADNPRARINAVEMLEATTSPRTARLIAALYDGSALSHLAQIGQETLNLSLPTLWEVFCHAWPQLAAAGREAVPPGRRPWLTALARHTLAEMRAAGLQEALASLPHLPKSEEQAMLTIIEKAILLSRVAVFENLGVDKLRVLASVSEEATYNAGQRIFAEGERGDALYITVSGKVSIQRQTGEAVTHLAELGPHEYFAEMSLFDNEPYSAGAVALEPSELLLVRREPLVALIKQHPELALGLFQVLGQRLRRANETIAQLQAGRTGLAE